MNENQRNIRNYFLKELRRPGKQGDSLQWNALRADSKLIYAIRRPTPEMILYAVQKSGHGFELIKEPSEKITIKAIDHNYWNFKYIKNPNKKITKFALKKSGILLQYIKDPSEELINIALSNCGDAIRHVLNPTEEMCLKAVQNNGLAIQYISDPSEEVVRESIKNNIQSVRYIKNPTELDCWNFLFDNHANWNCLPFLTLEMCNYVLSKSPLEKVTINRLDMVKSNKCSNIKYLIDRFPYFFKEVFSQRSGSFYYFYNKCKSNFERKEIDQYLGSIEDVHLGIFLMKVDPHFGSFFSKIFGDYFKNKHQGLFSVADFFQYNEEVVMKKRTLKIKTSNI